jgi:hypothetical protein
VVWVWFRKWLCVTYNFFLDFSHATPNQKRVDGDRVRK